MSGRCDVGDRFPGIIVGGVALPSCFIEHFTTFIESIYNDDEVIFIISIYILVYRGERERCEMVL